MKVNILNYINVHGTKPRGQGAWSFLAANDENKIAWITPKGNCNYSVAKAIAIREAKEQGFTELFLNA